VADVGGTTSAVTTRKKELVDSLIPKDKTQLINLLNKQSSITVLAMQEGKPSEVADQIKLIKQGRVNVIVIKS
jgi:predicted amino acid racemase